MKGAFIHGNGRGTILKGECNREDGKVKNLASSNNDHRDPGAIDLHNALVEYLDGF